MAKPTKCESGKNLFEFAHAPRPGSIRADDSGTYTLTARGWRFDAAGQSTRFLVWDRKSDGARFVTGLAFERFDTEPYDPATLRRQEAIQDDLAELSGPILRLVT